MKKIVSKKNLSLIIVCIIFIGLILWVYQLGNKKIVGLEKSWSESVMPYSNSVVCKLKLSSSWELVEEKLKIISQAETEPLQLTFIWLNSKSPSMVGNLWDQSPLMKIENWNVIYLIEETGAGNLNVFTLFRDKNILTLTKQYSLLGSPFALLMIWDCLAWTDLGK